MKQCRWNPLGFPELPVKFCVGLKELYQRLLSPSVQGEGNLRTERRLLRHSHYGGRETPVQHFLCRTERVLERILGQRYKTPSGPMYKTGYRVEFRVHFRSKLVVCTCISSDLYWTGTITDASSLRFSLDGSVRVSTVSRTRLVSTSAPLQTVRRHLSTSGGPQDLPFSDTFLLSSWTISVTRYVEVLIFTVTFIINY